MEYVSFPSTFKSFYGDAEFKYRVLKQVDWHCPPPSKITSSPYDVNIVGNGIQYFPRKYAVAWRKYIGLDRFYGYVESIGNLRTALISSSIRENDPTIMDVVCKVTSTKSSVKVRVLAFENGERSFAKVVRPETFVTDTNGVETACNVGDNVTPNVEHTISWRVSSDWKTKLAKMKFEVLVCEGELLPLELMTIPASGQYGKMKISWNAISESQVIDALFWLYADHTEGLTLANGVLRDGNVGLVKNDKLGELTYTWSSDYWNWNYYENALRYVYGKMGYSLLTGAPLTYANSETRLGLSPKFQGLFSSLTRRK